MTTYAQLAVRLLQSAAVFFRAMAGQNPDLQRQLEESAKVYDQIADLLEKDPNGGLEAEKGTLFH